MGICPHCGAGFCQKRRVLRLGRGTHGVAPESAPGILFSGLPSIFCGPLLSHKLREFCLFTHVLKYTIRSIQSIVTFPIVTFPIVLSVPITTHEISNFRNSRGPRMVLSSCSFDPPSGSYLSIKRGMGLSKNVGLYLQNQLGLRYHTIFIQFSYHFPVRYRYITHILD